ncbi:MAG: FkbM family methyltransferase [Spirochaetota bacterium]
MPVKEFIKNHPRLALILSKLRLLNWRPSSVNSQVILRNFAQKRRNVFFVQIGSNDGMTGDPLHSLIRNHEWRGLLVEPLPEIFADLQANYSGAPGLAFENSVISAKSGKTPLYTLQDFNGHNCSQVSSLVFEVISKQKEHMPDFADRFTLRYVNSMTMNELLAKHAIENIDLLHIDAEGYDAEILRMLDFDRFQPSAILFESEHLSSDTYRKCLTMLKQNGYPILFRDGQDTLALRSAEFL